MRLATFVLLAVALAGCAAAPPAPREDALHAFSGRFLDGTPIEEREDVFQRIVDAGGKVGATDDLPPSRFSGYDLRPDVCEALWARVGALPHVERTVACRPFTPE